MEITKTWDDQRMKRDRTKRIQDEMKRHGMGAMYLGDLVNSRYALNVKIPGGKAFVPAEGEVIAFARPRDVGYVKMTHDKIMGPYYGYAWDPTYSDKLKRFAEGLKGLMAEAGAAGEVLGVDEIEPAAILALLDAGVKVADAGPVVEYARAIKTPDEIAIYKELGKQYAHTFTRFRDALKPGVAENALASMVVAEWQECGGEEMFQLNVCAGENMNPWRRWPSARKVKENEFVGIDLHGRSYNGLQGDASRTFFVGDKPTPAQGDLYKKAYTYLQETTQLFRGGRAIPELLQSLPRVEEKYVTKLYNYNVGHCIGVIPSGYPTVAKWKAPLDDTLKPNQILAIETYFGEEGSPEAVKLEQMICVGDGAPERIDLYGPFDERFIS